MKKRFKNKLFYFILGMIISSCVTAYAATNLLSKDIGFIPDSSSWKVNNVQDALNDLYENDTFYIPYYKVSIDGQMGGEGEIKINSEKYNILTIDSRTRSGVAGTTYWEIFGYDNADCNGTNTQLLATTDISNSLETFDISEYKCITLKVRCATINNVRSWYYYYYNGVTLSR